MMIGTGLQNKLLEAMAVGIPCITTDLANNALLAKPNEEILIANDVETFVYQIDVVLNNKDLYAKLSKNGKKFVREKYAWKPLNDKLAQLLIN
jgi:polysaccharide biosynthesis protein PslH